MVRRHRGAGAVAGTGTLLLLTLVGVLAAVTACSSGGSDGDEGAGDRETDDP